MFLGWWHSFAILLCKAASYSEPCWSLSRLHTRSLFACHSLEWWHQPCQASATERSICWPRKLVAKHQAVSLFRFTQILAGSFPNKWASKVSWFAFPFAVCIATDKYFIQQKSLCSHSQKTKISLLMLTERWLLGSSTGLVGVQMWWYMAMRVDFWNIPSFCPEKHQQVWCLKWQGHFHDVITSASALREDHRETTPSAVPLEAWGEGGLLFSLTGARRLTPCALKPHSFESPSSESWATETLYRWCEQNPRKMKHQSQKQLFKKKNFLFFSKFYF